MSFNFRHLKYFVATAELGQVSQAAIQLSISQSAVTAAIKELEQIVGVPLFRRSASGMTLTDAGRQFLAAAYQILSDIDEALTVRDAAPQVSGQLTIAASYTVIGYFLPYHLERLARFLPNLEIRIFELTREMIEEGLLSNRFDMGVALTANIVNSDLHCETLIRSKRRLWASSRHHLLKSTSVHFADIAEEPFVMLTVDEAAHTAMRYWSPTNHQPRVVLRTSSIEAVRSIVANGQGVSILSDMVYRPWSLEGRRLETVDVDEPIPPMDVGLVWRKDVAFTGAMDAFRGYFSSHYLTPQNPVGRACT